MCNQNTKKAGFEESIKNVSGYKEYIWLSIKEKSFVF